MVGDPDDHRPHSSWRLVVDPGDEAGRVDSLAMIEEEVAVGDRIPLHVHDVDEVIAVIDGQGEAHLGGERQQVGAGSSRQACRPTMEGNLTVPAGHESRRHSQEAG